MPVFSRYNPRAAGGVLRQAHPNAEAYPWIPPKTTTRADPNWGGAGRVHRIGPHERGKTFTSSSLSVGPSMGSSGCGCKKGMPTAQIGVNKKA
jgi:hypothetical protein